MTAAPPFVSVVIPTYNYSPVLRYAIMSVLNQTLADFELIVVGDACTDDSAEVVASFSDPRVRWHNLPQNTGSQGAPNGKGWELAHGKYMAYLGHDDLWLPDHLELLSAQVERDGADWGYSIAIRIGSSEFPYRTLGGYRGEDMRWGRGITVNTLMHRRDITGVRWHALGELPPGEGTDTDFVKQLIGGQFRESMLDWPTVLLFVASHRRAVYATKTAEEQARYWERICNEPNFLQNELFAVARAYAIDQNNEPDILNIGESSTPGHLLDQLRRVRGLEAKSGRTDLEVPQLVPAELSMRQRIEHLEAQIAQSQVEVTRLAQENVSLLAQVQEAHLHNSGLTGQLDQMQNTRVWKLAQTFWRVRDQLTRSLHQPRTP